MTSSRGFHGLRTLLLWAAFTFVLAAPGRAAEPDSAAAPTLAGVWTLDVGKSDDAREKMQTMGRPAGRGPGGGGPGGRGGGGGGGMRGGMRGRPPGGPGQGPGGGEPESAARGPEMRLIMRPPASMLIEQTDSTVVLFEQGLPIEVLVIGLPQDRAAAVEPGTLHIPATWSGRRLTALREEERGGRASQQLTLSADGNALTLVLRREPYDDRPPIEVRREYRRQD